MRKVITAATVAAFAMASTAGASILEQVDLTFQSGATFQGTVAFADDLSRYSAVNGVLNGYTPGTTFYTITGADPISWVFDPSQNFATDTLNSYQNFLMDGTPGTYGDTWFNFIAFGYDDSAAGITPFAGGLGSGAVNNVDLIDPLVSGTVQPVPEPATLALLCLGLAGVGLVRWRRTA